MAILCALRRLAKGDEIVIPGNPVVEAEGLWWPLEMTFDGGARNIKQCDVCGRGAILSDMHIGPVPKILAGTRIAIFGQRNSQLAETAACASGLALLLQCGSTVKRARVVGDNLAVIRHGSDSAKLRRLQTQAWMEPNLVRLYNSVWAIDWHAVRRRLNMAVDAIATQSLYWAL